MKHTHNYTFRNIRGLTKLQRRMLVSYLDIELSLKFKSLDIREIVIVLKCTKFKAPENLILLNIINKWNSVIMSIESKFYLHLYFVYLKQITMIMDRQTTKKIKNLIFPNNKLSLFLLLLDRTLYLFLSQNVYHDRRSNWFFFFCN